MSTISMVGGRLHGQSVDQIRAAAMARSRAMQRNRAKGIATPPVRPVIAPGRMINPTSLAPATQVTPAPISVSTPPEAVVLPANENAGVPKSVPWLKYGLIGGGIFLAVKIFGGRGE